MLNPNEVRQHPWGNAPLHSEAHAQWLFKKLSKRINKALRENKTKNIDLKSDVMFFPRVRELLTEDAHASGWDVIWWDRHGGSSEIIDLKEL